MEAVLGQGLVPCPGQKDVSTETAAVEEEE